MAYNDLGFLPLVIIKHPTKEWLTTKLDSTLSSTSIQFCDWLKNNLPYAGHCARYAGIVDMTKKSTMCAINSLIGEEQIHNQMTIAMPGENCAYDPRTEEGYCTQSWHITNGSLEEVSLKRENGSVGNGGREEKAQEGSVPVLVLEEVARGGRSWWSCRSVPLEQFTHAVWDFPVNHESRYWN